MARKPTPAQVAVVALIQRGVPYRPNRPLPFQPTHPAPYHVQDFRDAMTNGVVECHRVVRLPVEEDSHGAGTRHEMYRVHPDGQVTAH